MADVEIGDERRSMVGPCLGGEIPWDILRMPSEFIMMVLKKESLMTIIVILAKLYRHANYVSCT